MGDVASVQECTAHELWGGVAKSGAAIVESMPGTPSDGSTTVVGPGGSGAADVGIAQVGQIMAVVRGKLFGRGDAGRLVGRYQIERRVGEGGAGVVYEALDTLLGRRVAVKALTAGRGFESERLMREAAAMARLSHPNVVPLYDVVASPASDDAPETMYLVMELVEGPNLRQWLGDGHATGRAIVKKFIAAGRGLAAAHRAGIVHRDFKPSNVIVAADGTPQLTDFGLARFEGVEPSEDDAGSDERDDLTTPVSGPHPTLTRTGQAMGTPRYMSPEQYEGGEVDARSDQYSFCVALYEALVGQPPFATGAGLADRKRTRELTPLPDRRRLSRRLQAALLRGLDPDPGRRHASMDALLGALAPRVGRGRLLLVAAATVGVAALAFQGGASTDQRCKGAAAQLEGVWDATRRAEVEAAILGIEASYAADVWARSSGVLDRYATEWVESHTDSCEATTVRGEQSSEVMDLRMACLHRSKVEFAAVTTVLAGADAEVVRNSHEVLGGLRSLSRCADVRALQADVEPPEPDEAVAVESARELLARADVEHRAGRSRQARETVAAARRALDGIDYGPVRTELALAQGVMLDFFGEREAAEAALAEALESGARWRQWDEMGESARRLLHVLGQTHGAEALRYRALAEGLSAEDPQDEAAFLTIVGVLLKSQGKHAESEQQQRRALALLKQGLDPEDPSVATSHNNVALILRTQGKYEEAETHARQALAISKKALGSQHPAVADAHGALAGVLFGRGEHHLAESSLRRALALREAAFGLEHPLVERARNNLAVVLEAQGKYEEAESEIRRVLASEEARLGPDHPDLAGPYNTLGVLLKAMGRYEESERVARRALFLWEQARGPEYLGVAAARNNLALLFEAQGAYDEAEAEHRRALAIRQKVLGPEHPDVLASLDGLGGALRKRGKFEEAERQYREALRLSKAKGAPEHPNVASVRRNLAELLLDRDRPSEALEFAESAWRRYQGEHIRPEHRAEAAFALARARWHAGGEPHRRQDARSLAQRALDDYRAAGAAHAETADEVATWLRAHSKR